MNTHRVLDIAVPFAQANSALKRQAGIWPARWIGVDSEDKASVRAFRCRFSVETAQTIRVHVTADNRYELFLDGERIGRGSERGDARHWFFETYDLSLEAGEHTIVARVWWLPAPQTPFAQHSVHPGFLLCPDDENFAPLLATGVALWSIKELGGYSFTDPQTAWGTGDNVVIDGAQFAWNFERGDGENESWQRAQTETSRAATLDFAGINAGHANNTQGVHELRPAMLPPQLDILRHVGRVVIVAQIASLKTCDVPIREIDNLSDDRANWQRLLSSQSQITVPAKTRHRVIVDLEDYYCAYPEIVCSGGAGATIRINWQEALFQKAKNSSDKGNRDETEGKYFRQIWTDNDGIGDTFLPDGGSNRFFSTLWWQCGRYVEIVVETAESPLFIKGLAWRETRYPTETESVFGCDDDRVLEVAPMLLRTLQMCSHETFMDCPWYEQLQYIGDTRLQVLTAYSVMRDDRLARKALLLFDASRFPDGLTQSRYPSRVTQWIQTFSLWWVAMVHDYAMWRDDTSFVKGRMHGVRTVLDGYERFVNADGVTQMPTDALWNFSDWVPAWPQGSPPTTDGIDSLAALQRVLVLRQAAELEELFGEKEMAIRWRRRARAGEDAIVRAFWNEARGLFADTLAHDSFSEHAQCLAILTYERNGFAGHENKIARVGKGLLNGENIHRTTIYFTHYLFEAYRVLERMDLFFARLELWFSLKENGLKTTVEMPEPTRSDCHAWGAHPLFHQSASVLGIRPLDFGFSRVEIRPQLAHLKRANGTMPHPRGEIAIDIQRDGETLNATVLLPPGVTGVFRQGEQTVELQSGTQQVSL